MESHEVKLCQKSEKGPRKTKQTAWIMINFLKLHYSPRPANYNTGAGQDSSGSGKRL
jgi:hypothetical protein